MPRILNNFAYSLISWMFPIAFALLKASPRLQTLVISSLRDSPLFSRAQAHLTQNQGRTFQELVGPRADLRWLDRVNLHGITKVTILIPVFNAYEAIVMCLQSLELTVTNGSTILILDDCSTDDRIKPLLQSYKDKPNFRIESNSTNLGYTKSINRGLELAGREDVVLLNSDTLVTGRWLESLSYLAHSSAKVATVTAISDNSGAFSVTPNPIRTDNLHTAQEIGRQIVQSTDGRLLDVPTGNGFCMYVRRDALDELGFYDDNKYPRGYGEENDFSMRAYRAGWKSLVCDKAFVFHLTSQSFGEEKHDLISQGLRQLDLDYPEYRLLTNRFWDYEFQKMRGKIAQALHSHAIAKRRVLYLMPIVGGGLPATNSDLRLAVKEDIDAFVAVCRGDVITLHISNQDDLGDPIESYQLQTPLNPISHRSEEYDRVLLDMMYRHSIEVVHIEHLAWQSLGIAEAAKSIGIRTVTSVHDFYAVCASHNLLDENMNYCGGTCTPSKGDCGLDLWSKDSLPLMKHNFIDRWRQNMSGFYKYCDLVVAPSLSAFQTITGSFSEIANKTVTIPHGRNFPSFIRPNLDDESKSDKLKVLVPGNIGVSKGSLLISAVSNLDTDNKIEFHFLGETSAALRSVGVHHGPYKREEFQNKVREIGPEIAAIFSIWAETFCHTLTESWVAGLPVVAFDVGAVGDRIEETKAGWLMPLGSAPIDVLRTLLSIANDRELRLAAQSAVEDWQGAGALSHDLDFMREQYLNAYQFDNRQSSLNSRDGS